MRKQISINTLTKQLKYYPATGMFEWLERGKGRALGEFAGTAVSKTYKDIFEKAYDPRTGEYLGLTNPHDVVKHIGYIIRVDGNTYPAHMLAYALQTGRWARVSHINGDKYDNRWINLTDDREKARKFAQTNADLYAEREAKLAEDKKQLKEEYAKRYKNIVDALWKKYKYDPETGLFMRIDGRYEQWERGTPIKSNGSRTLFFTLLDGTKTSCPCHVAAYILMNGTYPDKRVIHINNDKKDNRWVNLGIARES